MDTPLVVLTGFGAFEEVATNPSGLLVEGLVADPPRGVEVIGRRLPVSFRRAPQAFDALLAGIAPRRPDLILALGVCKESGFRIELRAGVELGRGRADVDGEDGVSQGLRGPTRRSSLDGAPLLAAMAAATGGRVRLSEEAGGYVCERLYHHALGAGQELGCPTLFVHVPHVEHVPIEQQRRALAALIEAVLADASRGTRA